jgi:hypothetical protein
MSLAFRFIRANTPEERATVDLEVHYTKVEISLHFAAITQNYMGKEIKPQSNV